MRFRRVLQNGIFGAGRQILVILLGLVNRTIFIRFLGLEYLGYTSLFSNILTWLSFAEGGFFVVMEYRLYQANATHDDALVASTMKLYRTVYHSLGILILVVGVSITGLTPLLVKQDGIMLDTLTMYKIYWLQLLAAVLGYFGSYWRVFIQAKQEAYLCEISDSVSSILVQAAQFLILLCWRNLYWYLGIKIVEVAVKNLLITVIAKKRYPNVLPPGTPTLPFRASGILHDVKNYLFQKFAYFIYIATDSVVISRFCGIVTVGIYSNYLLIHGNVKALLFTTPFLMAQASISNFLVAESDEAKEQLISILDIVIAIYSAALCCGFLACFQPTISWWLGDEALLPFGFVVLLVINTYIEFAAEPLYKIRATYGDYEDERVWMSLSALSNLILSILLSWKWGVSGVEVGTIVGMLFIAAGRARFASTHCTFFKLKPYLWKHLKFFGAFAVEAVAVYYITRNISATLPGILCRGAIAVLVSVAISILFLHRSADFQAAYAYFKFQARALRKKNT